MYLFTSVLGGDEEIGAVTLSSMKTVAFLRDDNLKISSAKTIAFLRNDLITLSSAKTVAFMRTTP